MFPNIQKSLVFLYINNEQMKIKKIISFITASKRMEDLGINLTKEANISTLENTKHC